ncbi:MAG TPA: radical SAM protein [Patescibacteria group bacterium]|nr:radical SAM protein [Patescibacteria group bacterium]
MKALLINPPTGIFIREDRCQSAVSNFSLPVVRPPMDLMMMAASLEKLGFSCKIKDYPLQGGGWRAYKKDIEDFKPDYLIISTTSSTITDDMVSCTIAKRANERTVTIAKGADLYMTAEDALRQYKNLDIAITGECESVITDIVTMKDTLGSVSGIAHRNAQAIIRNADRAFLGDLDLLPLPARHLVDNRLYQRLDTGAPMAVIEAGRGCPHRCIFCLAGRTYGRQVRYRSVASIIQEIVDCLKDYRIRDFHFKSDIFTWDREWVMRLCRGIVDRGMKINWICNSRVDTLDAGCLRAMKQAGCWAISLGVESGSQEMLDRMKKGITLAQSVEAVKLCKAAGIKTYVYFLIGFPWDTEQTIRDSVEFAQRLGGDFADFFSVYPFRGTELETIAREYGLLGRHDRRTQAYADTVIDTFFLPKQRVEQLRKEALKKFYLRPRYIFNALRDAGSPKRMVNYIKYGLKLLRVIS